VEHVSAEDACVYVYSRRAAQRSRANSPSIQASSTDTLTVHSDDRKGSCDGTMIFILCCTGAQFVDRGIVNDGFCIEVVGDRASGIVMFDGLVMVRLVRVYDRANGIAVQASVGSDRGLLVHLVRVNARANGIAVQASVGSDRGLLVMIVDILVFEAATRRTGGLGFLDQALFDVLGGFMPPIHGETGVYRGIRRSLLAARAGGWDCAVRMPVIRCRRVLRRGVG